MNIKYYYNNMIERSNLSSQDKKILKDFLEVLDKYKYEPDKFPSYTKEEIKHIFQIAKINPKMQIEMWKMLPDDIVNNLENLEIFESILDNKFGEYIKDIDKKALVKTLNGSRLDTRRN